jgi:hypothetical protein
VLSWLKCALLSSWLHIPFLSTKTGSPMLHSVRLGKV